MIENRERTALEKMPQNDLAKARGFPTGLPYDRWLALEKAGKATLYRNGNWKDDVLVMLCKPDEVRPFLPADTAGTRFDPDRAAGLAHGFPGRIHGRTWQLLWIRETRDAWRALAALVHEAIHVAGFALAAREVPLDLRFDGANECLGFFVEDLLAETLPFFERRLGIRGADLPRRGTRRDRRARCGGKRMLLEAMKKFGVSFEHEDTTWRATVTAAVCNADDAGDLFDGVLETESGPLSESSDCVWFATNASHALVWADGSQGARTAFASLANGAVRAAGIILAGCGVDVNVAKTGSSECIAYFVEHFFNNIRPWFLSRFAGTLELSAPEPAAG